MPVLIDMTGKKFGRLTVIAVAPKRSRRIPWRCQCDCGNNAIVDGSKLRNGHTQSCGCYMLQRNSESHRTHGRSNADDVTYQRWLAMRARAYSNHDISRPKYKDRGITVCRRWKSFENFLADLGECPSAEHSLDRRNNNRGYTPKNCRWATLKEQARNKRNNRKYRFSGKMRTAGEIVEISKTPISESTFVARITRYGWPLERALSEPPGAWKRQ